MVSAALDPGWVVAIVVFGAAIVGAIGMYFMAGSLRRWREGFDVSATKETEELLEEVRQLVLAANARRARRGEPPLDVEAEIERRLRDARRTSE